MRALASLITLLTLIALPYVAYAADDGCGKFAWPLERERGWFAASNKLQAGDGDALATWPQAAVRLRLNAGKAAKFVLPPERKPSAESSFGGMLRWPPPGKSGLYQITLSDDAWVDVIQAGQFMRSAGSTGRRDCPGVRKSVRINLDAAPLTLQFSGVESDTISVAIMPVE